MAQRIIVVGAGILGCTLTHKLTEDGASVTLCDVARPGDGATGNSFAWINAKSKRPRAYYELNMLGMAAHRRLADRLGDATWWHASGTLLIAPKPDMMKQEEIDLIRSWGYRAEWLGRRALARIEPDLIVDDSTEDILFFPDEGYIYPREFLGRLVASSVSNGAQTRFSCRVADLVIEGSRVRGVRFDDGETLNADTVILAAGLDTVRLASQVNYNLPIVRVGKFGSNGMGVQRQPLGLLGITSSVPTSITRLIKTPEIQFRPDGGGRLLLQSHQLELELGLDDRTDRPPFPVQTNQLLELARKRISGLDSARIESVRMGIRIIPDDGLPVLGAAPGIESGLYITVAHSGITQAPAIAELVTREVLLHREEPLLSDFRPARFAGDQNSVKADTSVWTQ